MQFFFLDKKFPRPETTSQNLGLFWFTLNGNIFIRESDMLGNLNIVSDLGETPKNIDLRHVESELAKCSEKYEAHQTFLQKWLICVEEHQSRMIWISFIRSMYRNILQIPGTRGNRERPVD